MSYLTDVLADKESNSDLLLHFTKMETAFEHILQGYLRPSPFSNMTDPLEAGPLSAAFTSEDYEKIKNSFARVNDARSRMKFLSFCCDEIPSDDEHPYPFNKGFSKSRMWCQYANGHRGLCLVFSKEKLLSVTPVQVLKFAADYVSYDNRLPQVIHGCLTSMPHLNDPNDFIEKHKKPLLFSKTHDYRDESEFRIVFRNESDLYHVPYEDALIGVITGVNMPDSYLPILKNRNKTNGIDFVQIHWGIGEPWIMDYPETGQ